MSWRRIALIYVVLSALVGYLLVFERGEAPVPEPTDPGSAAASLLGTEASSVTSVTFRRGEKVVRAHREDGRWQVIEPSGAQVPRDLLEATIATLTAGQAAEKLTVEPEGGLAAYGLEAPSAAIDVVTSDVPKRSVTVLIGGRNPTRTAVYARRSDQASIFLVGMNLSYYLDLILDAAGT